MPVKKILNISFENVKKNFCKGAPLIFFVFVLGFNFDFQAMVFTDSEKFAFVEIFIENGRSF